MLLLMSVFGCKNGGFLCCEALSGLKVPPPRLWLLLLLTPIKDGVARQLNPHPIRGNISLIIAQHF